MAKEFNDSNFQTEVLASDKLTDEEPSAAVAVPVQVLLRFPGVATTKPSGKLSVKALSELVAAVALITIAPFIRA